MSSRIEDGRSATLGFDRAPVLGSGPQSRQVAPAWRTATLVLAGLWIVFAMSLVV
jgi:hypothetical protein